MSQSAQGSSPLSSPSSSIRDLISPEKPSSPTPASSQSVRADRASPLPSARAPHKIDNACARGNSPKREYGEIEEEDTARQPRKYRAAPRSESSVTTAKQQTSLEANNTSKEDTAQSSVLANRPSRARKPPKEFWVVDEKKQKSVNTAVPSKKPRSRVFDPVFITSNSNSRLVKADVYHLLLEDLAWTSLSSSQQQTLLSMLPHSLANQKALDGIAAGETEIPRPEAFTMSNDCFRTDVAKFKEDLGNGHLAKTWQAAAEQAVVERANGEYDDWKAEEAEMWWGQKSK